MWRKQTVAQYGTVLSNGRGLRYETATNGFDQLNLSLNGVSTAYISKRQRERRGVEGLAEHFKHFLCLVEALTEARTHYYQQSRNYSHLQLACRLILSILAVELSYNQIISHFMW